MSLVTLFQGGFSGEIGQATETDIARSIRPTTLVATGQASESDSSFAVAAARAAQIGRAIETDTATRLATSVKLTGSAGLVAVLGGAGIAPGRVSAVEKPGSPVLLRGSRGAGAVFHEVVSPAGDTYHPTVDDWFAEEEAPGGLGSAGGIISESTYAAHREVFTYGPTWRTFLERDGTCVYGGRMMEPEVSGGVQITARGWAARAERELDRLFLQSRDIGAWRPFSGRSSYWSVENVTLRMETKPGSLKFTRGEKPAAGKLESGVQTLFWVPGVPLTRLAFRVQSAGGLSTGALVTVTTSKTARVDLEPTMPDQYENWYGHMGSGGSTLIDVDIDLTLGSGGLSWPNTVGDNRGDPDIVGEGYVYPDAVMFLVGDDWDLGQSGNLVPYSVDIYDLRVNGEAGDADRLTASELVLHIAGLMGLRFTDIQPSGVNVLPYDIETSTLAEPLDYAALLTGWRWLILDTGSHAVLEFGPYNERTWALSSPWTPLSPIPMERFDHVRVPFMWADGETVGSVAALAEPHLRLERRNSFGTVAIDQAAPDEGEARALAERLVEVLAKPRWGGHARLTEVEGANGHPVSAQHVRAGDLLRGRLVGGPNGLRVGSLRRTYGGVEVEFDGEHRALQRMLARRDRRMALRTGAI